MGCTNLWLQHDKLIVLWTSAFYSGFKYLLLHTYSSKKWKVKIDVPLKLQKLIHIVATLNVIYSTYVRIVIYSLHIHIELPGITEDHSPWFGVQECFSRRRKETQIIWLWLGSIIGLQFSLYQDYRWEVTHSLDGTRINLRPNIHSSIWCVSWKL